MPMKVDYFAGVSRVTVRGVQPAPATSLRRLGLAKVAPLIGRVVGGRYRIDALLGRGTTSIVCRASRLDGGGGVAVKVLSPVSSELVDAAVSDRFRFEAQALAGISHPNVVSVVDFGTTEDGLLYTVLELLRGETLGRRLAARGRLEPVEAVRIAGEAAEGLHILHEQGLLHRDVKPANIFIARRDDGVEVVKLMDLGLCRVLGPARTDDSAEAPLSDEGPRRRMHTREGLVLGTGPYMSPELIQGAELDPRSDVYALGVVTYRMLAGTLPFAGNDLPLLLSRHIHDPVEPLVERAPSAGLSAALDAVVLRALEKDRERRPATARDFALELHAALGSADLREIAVPFESGRFAERLHAALAQADEGDAEEEDDVGAAFEQAESDGGHVANVAEAASGRVSIDAIDAAFEVRRPGARWIAVAIVVAAALFTAFAVTRHRQLRMPARPAPSFGPASRSEGPVVPASPPDTAPWDLAVGPARLDAVPRPRVERRAEPSRPDEASRGARKHPKEARVGSKFPATPPAAAPENVAPPDDFKVPRWHTSTRPDP
jgi:serine/threonine-protein kinase